MLSTLALFTAVFSQGYNGPEWLYDEMDDKPMMGGKMSAESAIEEMGEKGAKFMMKMGKKGAKAIKKLEKSALMKLEDGKSDLEDKADKMSMKMKEMLKGSDDVHGDILEILEMIKQKLGGMMTGKGGKKVDMAIMKMNKMIKKLMKKLPKKEIKMLIEQDMMLDDMDMGSMDSMEMDFEMDATTKECLNSSQKRKLQISMASIQTVLSVSVTSLNIAALFKSGKVKKQLEQSSRIIKAVNTELIAKLQPIILSTCGTCLQISTNVAQLTQHLTATVSAAVPDFATNPIFNAVTQVITMIATLVPSFCPQPQMDMMFEQDAMTLGLPDSVDMDDLDMMMDATAKECLNSKQKRTLKISLASIQTVLSVSVTSLNIAAMFKSGSVKAKLERSSKIVGAVNSQLVAKLEPIVTGTCGSCSQISTQVGSLTAAITATLGESVPEWKTNPIFSAVTQVVNMIVNLVPSFCPQPQNDVPMMDLDSLMMDPMMMDDMMYDDMDMDYRRVEETLPASVEFMDAMEGVMRRRECLNSKQKRNMAITIATIQTSLTAAKTGLDIAAIFKRGKQKKQLQVAARVVSAVNSELVAHVSPIVNSACGSCAAIAGAISQIVTRLTATLSKSAPDWQTNPIYQAVTTVVQTISAIVPTFCPQQA